jgi:hypothetical protein
VVAARSCVWDKRADIRDDARGHGVTDPQLGLAVWQSYVAPEFGAAGYDIVAYARQLGCAVPQPSPAPIPAARACVWNARADIREDAARKGFRPNDVASAMANWEGYRAPEYAAAGYDVVVYARTLGCKL